MTGNRSRYCSIRPRHMALSRLTRDSHVQDAPLSRLGVIPTRSYPTTGTDVLARGEPGTAIVSRRILPRTHPQE
ncbi:hypothetical protein Prum_030270 [Phytohabitans rumicis]|uniref:Uncharacterized protein n=1 Tax=Phytohabitans rumicis TaxID=1076125 RepID=A0A6V8L9K3_9ACTN|nr:hypothetical protein Prum_030270 [Phytohabitans rumicis]